MRRAEQEANKRRNGALLGFAEAVGRWLGTEPEGREQGRYRLRVWITNADKLAPEPMTNPTRYDTRADAAAVARMMPVIGIQLENGTVLPGNRIYQVEVIDTREESRTRDELKARQ